MAVWALPVLRCIRNRKPPSHARASHAHELFVCTQCSKVRCPHLYRLQNCVHILLVRLLSSAGLCSGFSISGVEGLFCRTAFFALRLFILPSLARWPSAPPVDCKCLHHVFDRAQRIMARGGRRERVPVRAAVETWAAAWRSRSLLWVGCSNLTMR